jgi:phage terminase large subunit
MMPTLANRSDREEYLALLEERSRREQIRARQAELERLRWRPRPYQQSLWTYLQGGGRRADVVAHRRWGKDDVALNWAREAAERRVGNYWHMLPEAAQARKAIWDAINPHTGRKRIDEAFPFPEVRIGKRDTDMSIQLRNGSTWQLVGSDNYNSLVGSPPVGVVFSEWALAKPEAWTYLRPILAENGGWALFIWTPRGRNHAARAFESREQDKTWFTLRSRATETSVFTPEQLAKERADLIAECGSEDEGDAKYRQEYLVDFDAAVPGSYYGSHIAAAREEGRIGDFPYDPALPVLTAWDIGVDDYMAIWFLQENGQQVRAIDYYEASGEGAEQAADLLKSKPYSYGTHHLPHDVMVREWGGGARSRFQTLLALGVKPVRVGVAQDPAERINAARRLLPVVSFDAKKCALGLDRLRNYRKRWNASLSAYTGPLHDENSHGADAFGEFAVNCRIVAKVAEPAKPKRTDYKGANLGGGNGWIAA